MLKLITLLVRMHSESDTGSSSGISESERNEVSYEASQVISIRNVKNYMEEKKHKSYSNFSCDEDPDSPEFSVRLRFGVIKDHISLHITSKSKDVRLIPHCCKFTLWSHLSIIKQVAFKEEHMLRVGYYHGWPEFYEIRDFDDINGDINSDLKLKCVLTYVGTSSDTVKCRSLNEDLLEMFESQKDADVTFTFRDRNGNVEEFKAHKIILKARSIYFQSLFESGMIESQSNEIEINEHPPLFKEMLKFLYTDKPPRNLKTISFQLLPLACKYLITNLKNLCVHSIGDNI